MHEKVGVIISTFNKCVKITQNMDSLDDDVWTLEVFVWH